MLRPTNPHIKSNINFCKEYGIKILMQNILRYTDMKEGMNNVWLAQNYKLYVRS